MSSKILVIGLGNMGSSLAKGLLNSKSKSSFEVYLHDIHKERELQYKGSSAKFIRDFSHIPTNLDAIIVCVKPHDLPQLGLSLGQYIAKSRALLCSILAGTEISDLESAFGYEGAVVRAMPNIAATISLAATALCANQSCTDLDRDLAEAIFESVGEVCWVKEHLMDSVTGLSGSGPAYIYMVIEALIDGGVKMGLPRILASKLAVQTVVGAASLVKATGEHPAILKDQVTTPAGTTISALHVLEQRGLRSMFVAAVEEATDRSKFIAKMKKSN